MRSVSRWSAMTSRSCNSRCALRCIVINPFTDTSPTPMHLTSEISLVMCLYYVTHILRYLCRRIFLQKLSLQPRSRVRMALKEDMGGQESMMLRRRKGRPKILRDLFESCDALPVITGRKDSRLETFLRSPSRRNLPPASVQ